MLEILMSFQRCAALRSMQLQLWGYMYKDVPVYPKIKFRYVHDDIIGPLEIKIDTMGH